VVPVTESRRLHAAFNQAGSPVYYTEYPGVGHNSWDPAFSDPMLWDWLFTQRRAAR
jgi:enterochelin esterase-like enzyme